MWYTDIDPHMRRTMNRPILKAMLHLGLFSSFRSNIAAPLFTVGVKAAFWSAFSVVFYGWSIHLVKRRTPRNIVIGGIAGSTPPSLDGPLRPVTIAAAMSLIWVHPCRGCCFLFLVDATALWALALYRSGEYGKVNIL